MPSTFVKPEDWKLSGTAKMTDAQRRLLNAVCGDLAAGIVWHGNRLSKDDWRHFLAGTVLGWRMLPGIDRGEGAPGFVMLGRSSLDLTKMDATDAIQLAMHLGDHPEEQGLQCKPVRWCAVVLGAMGFSAADEELAGRFAA